MNVRLKLAWALNLLTIGIAIAALILSLTGLHSRINEQAAERVDGRIANCMLDQEIIVALLPPETSASLLSRYGLDNCQTYAHAK